MSVFTTLSIPRSVGKRSSPAVVVETVSGHSDNRLSLQDRNSGIYYYLIDSGAEISVLPPNATDQASPNHSFILTPVNNSTIKTYSQKFVTLDIAHRRAFCWIIIIADVSKPIFGSDFLYHFKIVKIGRSPDTNRNFASLSMCFFIINFSPMFSNLMASWTSAWFTIDKYHENFNTISAFH